MMQAGFSPVNGPLLPLTPFNCPDHLRNQSLLSREGDVHVQARPLPPSSPPPSPVYGRSPK